MKTKNKVWLRLTTSIVIISLLYPNILLAQDKHLAPRSYKKGEMQAVMVCETIEKRARYGKPIERIYLDDILKWAKSSEEEFSGCRFSMLPHEIRIHLASNNIIVRYFDPTKTSDISEFETRIIGPRLHRQIIQTQIIQVVKALPAGKPSQGLPSPPKRSFAPLPILVIIASSLLLISTFLFTSITTLVLTSGAELIFSTDIAKLLPPLGAGVLLGGFAIGRWILNQIEYGAVLWRKGPIYDLLSRVVPPLKEKPKKPVSFTEYNYKVITNHPIEAIRLGLKLSDSEIEKLRALSSIKDNARRYMLYYGNRLAGIVTVSGMAHGIILVEVAWTSQEGKRQLSDDFIITELANRNPAGILFHSSDIDPEIIDRLLPNHTIADKKESTRRFKEKVLSRLKIEDKGQYTFFAMDRQDFNERRRLYFGSFRFSNLWKIAEIDHWIFSFASGLFFALVFSSIFSHAEAVKVLASYTFFEEYINLILTVFIAPLAARSIAKVIRLRWDPVRSRHGRRGSEDTWLSITQNMRMGWKIIGTFKILAYSRIFLSALGLLLIPAIGVVILGIISPYIYLGLMFLKLVTERIINEYEQRYYKEVSEVTILFNEAAKREGYAENFHNIDSTSEVFRELIYASALLIGYGISTCSILSPAVIPLAILAAIVIPISSFLIPIVGRDYKNYLKMWGKGFTTQSGGKVLLAEGVTMITNPDNPLVVHPRPVAVTDYFSILPWIEQLGVTIECKPGHRPIIEPKNPRIFSGLRPKKGRYILNWPEKNLGIELISRDAPIDAKALVVEEKPDGGCLIRFYPKPGPPQKPVGGISKDIAGKLAGDADPRLKEWLRQNTPDNTKVIDYYYEAGRWVAYKVVYKEDYAYGMDDKGEPMAEARYQLSDDEQKRLNRVMEEYTYDETGRQVRFRIVLGETGVGWSEDKNIDHSSFIHVGERTATIWFGEGLFMDLLSRDSYPLGGRVFSHEKRHLLGEQGIDEGKEYEDLTRDVCERCREIENLRIKIRTERFIDVVKEMPAKIGGRKIALALDTDIGNMTQFGIDELLKQIRDVSSLLGDIEFVAEKGAGLAGAVRKAVGERKDVDVIVVTKKKKEDFDSSYYITRVDDTRLNPRDYVPILELLTFALVLNLAEDSQLLKDIYKELTGSDLDDELKTQIRNGESIIPLLPPAEKIPEDSYNISIEVLKSA